MPGSEVLPRVRMEPDGFGVSRSSSSFSSWSCSVVSGGAVGRRLRRDWRLLPWGVWPFSFRGDTIFPLVRARGRLLVGALLALRFDGLVMLLCWPQGSLRRLLRGFSACGEPGSRASIQVRMRLFWLPQSSYTSGSCICITVGRSCGGT